MIDDTGSPMNSTKNSRAPKDMGLNEDKSRSGSKQGHDPTRNGGVQSDDEDEQGQEERKSDTLLKKTKKLLKQTQPTKKPKKEFMSPTYAHKLGYDFQLPKFDASGYI